MRFLILSLFVINCSTTDTNSRPVRIVVDSQLKPYVNSFETEFGIQAGDVSAIFQELDGINTLGACSIYTDGKRLIRVDPYWWEAYSETREQLMYHELLHCTVDADHNNELLEDGCPASLMHEYLISTDCYYLYKETYVNEYRRK